MYILRQRDDLLITEYTERNFFVNEKFDYERTGFFFALRMIDYLIQPINNPFEYLEIFGTNFVDQAGIERQVPLPMRMCNEDDLTYLVQDE